MFGMKEGSQRSETYTIVLGVNEDNVCKTPTSLLVWMCAVFRGRYEPACFENNN